MNQQQQAKAMTCDQLLGPSLVDADGTLFQTSEKLKDVNIVGLYFSAHWCLPCRKFTQDLVNAYNKHMIHKKCQIIFISSDRNDACFKEYMKEMPWVAVPFKSREVKARLSSKYGVRGIPKFVLLDAKEDCALIADNARGMWC